MSKLSSVSTLSETSLLLIPAGATGILVQELVGILLSLPLVSLEEHWDSREELLHMAFHAGSEDLIQTQQVLTHQASSLIMSSLLQQIVNSAKHHPLWIRQELRHTVRKRHEHRWKDLETSRKLGTCRTWHLAGMT